MCHCNPKITFIGKINKDGYAIQTCNICGEQKLIPATPYAIEKTYQSKHVYLSPKESLDFKY
jgi:hypothetical protein